MTLLFYLFNISERRQQIGVVRVVIVRTTVTVHIAEVIGVARIRRALPPVVGRITEKNIFI